MMGSCPRTRESFQSGVAHWLEYISIVHGMDNCAFPPVLDDILGWSLTFRCLGTFGNYLTHLRAACCAWGHPPPPVGDPVIKRAMNAVAKRQLHTPKPKLAIQRTMLRNMLDRDRHKEADMDHAMLWLMAYTWLLRVPSEALPVVKVSEDYVPSGDEQSIIWRDGDTICLQLRRRKNLPQGSGVIKRGCTCSGCPRTCPVHILWDTYMEDLPLGAAPFSAITEAAARKKIRERLKALGVPQCELYGTHDFRRGHARVPAC